MIAGFFNHADLRAVFPKFHQHIKCATRGAKTLDKTYSNIKHGYRATQLPHLGSSDHISLLLIPAYKPVRKQAPPTTRTVKSWPEGASQQLQDCLESTDWDIFCHQDLEVFTSAVFGYSQRCVNTVTVDRHIRVFPNQNPWMNGEVKELLRERNSAFRYGDRDLYGCARAALKRGIREAKGDYRQRIEEDFSSNNSRQVWKQVQHINNFRSSNTTTISGDASLAEELNNFFARFEAEAPAGPSLQPTSPHSQTFSVQVQEVRIILRSVNP